MSSSPSPTPFFPLSRYFFNFFFLSLILLLRCFFFFLHRCHDLSPINIDKHPNEHATRMLCGFCSREQAYHPSTCCHCHANVVGNKSGNNGSFWEGGKGMRDKVKMSRKGIYYGFFPPTISLLEKKLF